MRGAALLSLLLVCGCEKPPRDAGRPEVADPTQTQSTQDKDRDLAFVPHDADFPRKAAPRPGEWLHRHKERGRSFAAYKRSRPVRARKGEVLAFLPVGPFDAAEQEIFDKTVRFASLWFGLETRTLPPVALPDGWSRERRHGRQYKTRWFLDHLLPDRRPKDSVCCFAVTMADLYPQESWNFVFGQASLRGRVGVWSFHRFGEEGAAKLLRRACQLVVHEAGHAFSLEHCIVYDCTMNGSNSLMESDRQPLYLCPPCLKKLSWNRGFDVRKRYEALRAFCAEEGLREEAAWFANRLRRLGAGPDPTSPAAETTDRENARSR